MIQISKIKLTTWIALGGICGAGLTAFGAYAVQGYKVDLNAEGVKDVRMQVQQIRQEYGEQYRHLTEALNQIAIETARIRESVDNLKRADDRRYRQ